MPLYNIHLRHCQQHFIATDISQAAYLYQFKICISKFRKPRVILYLDLVSKPPAIHIVNITNIVYTYSNSTNFIGSSF